MDRVFKIVITGPFNSGKTTFIGTISEIEVVSTERTTRDGGGKSALTTVAMDFGRITLPDGYIIHLYGTPGQGRFDFMWEILSEGMLGYIVLMDGTDIEAVRQGREMLEAFARLSDAPFVIGLTRADRRNRLSRDEVAQCLAPWDAAPVLSCDARSIADVKSVIIDLLELVLARAEAADERAG